MGILLVRLIDVINEYSEDSTFYSIAYTMLLNFDNLQNLSINDVANLCHVSKSTISKFVRSLNFEDYSDFKAEAYFKENRFNSDYNYVANIQQYIANQDANTYIDKVIQDIEIIKNIDMTVIRKIAQIIYQYPKVTAFGTLFSQLGALDLQYKLVYNHKFIMSYVNDVKQDEYLKNNSEQGVVIIYSNSGNYLNKYQLSSFDEKKKYDYKNKKVILITANEMMVNHPDVDICLVYQHLSKLQTHSYIYPLINDLIVAEYRSFQNANF